MAKRIYLLMEYAKSGKYVLSTGTALDQEGGLEELHMEKELVFSGFSEYSALTTQPILLFDGKKIVKSQTLPGLPGLLFDGMRILETYWNLKDDCTELPKSGFVLLDDTENDNPRVTVGLIHEKTNALEPEARWNLYTDEIPNHTLRIRLLMLLGSWKVCLDLKEL